jgi:hypothetical protein
VPVEQQIVEIEHTVLRLALDVAPQQLADVLFEMRAPGVLALQRFLEGFLRVHAVRIDAEAGVLAREALALARKSHLGANGVEQVRRIGLVDDAERRVQTHVFGVMTQQAITGRMESPGPGQTLGERARLSTELVVEHVTQDFVRAAFHLDGSATSESEHEDAGGIGAADGQMRDAMSERIGLAGARTRDDEQRPGAETFSARHRFTVGHRLALRRVETSELFGRRHRYNNIRKRVPCSPGSRKTRDGRHAALCRSVTPF